MNKKNLWIIVGICLVIALKNANAGQVTISVKTNTYGGEYSPNECPAVMWIQTPQNELIKTIGIWCHSWWYNRLLTWAPLSIANPDGLSGATRTSHIEPISSTWNLTDRDNNPMSNGTYQFWVEFTEDYANSKTSFGTIVIDGMAKTVFGDTSTPYFKNFYAVFDTSTPVLRQKVNKRTGTQMASVCLSKNKIFIDFKENIFKSGSVSIFALNGKCVVSQSLNSGQKTLNITLNNHFENQMLLLKVSYDGKQEVYPVFTH